MLRRWYWDDTLDDANKMWTGDRRPRLGAQAIDAAGEWTSDSLWLKRSTALTQEGWRVHYQPAAQVMHHGSASGSQDLTRRHILFNTSKWRFYDKWFGPFWGAAVRWYLWATFGYEALVEIAKWLLRHKTTLRRQRVESYLRVLRSGLG
jgi:hypothetical protein